MGMTKEPGFLTQGTSCGAPKDPSAMVPGATPLLGPAAFCGAPVLSDASRLSTQAPSLHLCSFPGSPASFSMSHAHRKC